MDVRVTIHGATVLARQFAAASVRAPIELAGTVHTFGQLLETRIKAKASGRPGPNAPTGDYRRSWNTEFGMGIAGATATAVVGTSKPQGRRLEFGFVGEDSLGRHYNQPPYPHVMPAADEIEPEFERAVERLVERLVGPGRG